MKQLEIREAKVRPGLKGFKIRYGRLQDELQEGFGTVEAVFLYYRVGFGDRGLMVILETLVSRLISSRSGSLFLGKSFILRLCCGFMILRVWRCRLKSGAGEEFRRFAQETALPMLRRQDGCLYAVAGVSEDGGEACVVTVWRDFEALKGFVGERWWEPYIHQREAPLLAERPSVSHYKADAAFNVVM